MFIKFFSSDSHNFEQYVSEMSYQRFPNCLGGRLNLLFGGETSLQVYLKSKSLFRKAKESVETFALRVRSTMIAAIPPDETNAILATEMFQYGMMDTFLVGIRNPRLQEEIMGKSPSNLDKALLAAKNLIFTKRYAQSGATRNTIPISRDIQMSKGIAGTKNSTNTLGSIDLVMSLLK